jgi:hypothetical protein
VCKLPFEKKNLEAPMGMEWIQMIKSKLQWWTFVYVRGREFIDQLGAYQLLKKNCVLRCYFGKCVYYTIRYEVLRNIHPAGYIDGNETDT